MSFSVLVVAAVIYGMTMREIAHYKLNYPADDLTLKIWVYTIFILITAGLVLDSFNSWEYLSSTGPEWATKTRATVPLEGLFHVRFDFRSLPFGSHQLLNGDPRLSRCLSYNFFSSFGYTVVCDYSALFAPVVPNSSPVRKEVYPTSKLTTPMSIFYCLIGFSSLAVAIVANSLLFNPASVTSTTNLAIINATIEAKICLDAFLDVLITLTLYRLLSQHRNEFWLEHRWPRQSPIERLTIFFASRGLIILTFQVVFFVLVCSPRIVLSTQHRPSNPSAGIRRRVYDGLDSASHSHAKRLYAASMVVTVTNREPRRGESAASPSRSGRQSAAEHDQRDLILVPFTSPESKTMNKSSLPGGVNSESESTFPPDSSPTL
ncbi:hypothetical protein K488DRAFT_90044 [Vararia minispora EC-137]|uniref:Uncharacterized protein n=1 Tax=Vararia minispora EC-137 TaxID=1314806 RepID=A0ACB8QA69_9AGAM|nr:hypothetical protein K488DRAFT_90044 [Vararia minispora EC-137]